MKKQILWIFGLVFGMAFCSFGADTVLDDDFSTNAAGEGVPAGWTLYRQGPTLGKMVIGENGLYLKDVCDKSEIGITRILSAVPGKYYRLTAEVGTLTGRYGKAAPVLQLRFLSQPHKISNVSMQPGKPVVVTGQANADKLQIYLFAMKYGQLELTVRRVKLEVSDNPF